DGSWHGDPLATAVALVALMRVSEASDGEEQRTIAAMIERGLAALAGMQEPDGLFHARANRTEEDRALTAAYILYLLTDEHAFREAIRFADLMDYFEHNAARLEPDAERLLQLALLDVPALAGIGPARSASAA